MDEGGATPISYMALTKGTPVLATDGAQLGTVDRVLDDASIDLFDGIVVDTSAGVRFVDADAVVEITDKYVRTSAHAVADLPEPSGSNVYRPNDQALREKDTFFHRTLDVFRRKRPGWEREKDDD